MDGGRTFTRRFKSGGELVRTEVYLRLRDLDPGGSLDVDAALVPGLIGLVGELLAEARERAANLDTDYRSWRARTAISVLRDNPKQPEWKVRHEVEASPEFGSRKRAVAAAESDVAYLQLYHAALEAKASLVHARVKIQAAEVRGTSIGVDPAAAAARATDGAARATGDPQPSGFLPMSSRRDRVKSALRRPRKES